MRYRFLTVWVLWAGLYAVLSALGPNGLIPTLRWPATSQHLLQVRAWLGEDIELATGPGEEASWAHVAPRMDVTPYIRQRVVEDPRENAIIGNLACVVVDEGSGALVPLQEAWDGSGGDELLERAVCHVGFPPGPSFLMLPLRAALGGLLATQWLGALLGGLAVAAMDRLLGPWLREVGDGGAARRLGPGLTVLAGAGTLWLWMVPTGGTFLFAQTVATTFLTLALLLAWQRQWLLGGAAFALALASRPPTLLAAPLLLVILWRSCRQQGQSLRGPIMRAIVFPVVAVIAVMALNQQRFGSPLDFGYDAMISPASLLERQREHGQLSAAFLPGNLRFLVVQPPMVVRDADSGRAVFPFLASDPRGMGVFFVTPAFLAIFLVLRRRWLRQPLVLSALCSLVLVVLPGLLYFNTGWVQWGGRFLVDAWPLFLMLAAIGLQRVPPRVAAALISASVLSNLWAIALSVARVWPACCQ